MRWLLGAALLICAGSLWAQSLGDVAREQREDDNRPKAKHVYTNADMAAPEEDSVQQEKPSPEPPSRKTPPATVSVKNEPDPIRQRRIVELNQRAQLLESDMRGIQEQMTTLSRSSNYGDPNRAQKNQEMQQLADSYEAKRKELVSVRDELLEEIERVRKSSVLK